MIYQKLFELKQKEIILQKDTKWFNYSYATLKQIQEKLNPLLRDLNLIIFHFIENDEVITQIRDLEDNSFIESKMKIWDVKTTRTENFTDKNGKEISVVEYNDKDPQWVGSIITYYRRYNLLALLDLEQEDDDWVSWSNKAKAKSYEPKNKSNEEKPWFSEENLTKLKENLSSFSSWDDAIKKARAKYKVSNAFAEKIKNLFK